MDINGEQCIFCHASNEAKVAIPKENRFREIRTTKGERIIGFINPIEIEPDCYTADCHAHRQDEKLLELLDIKMSLSAVHKSATET